MTKLNGLLLGGLLLALTGCQNDRFEDLESELKMQQMIDNNQHNAINNLTAQLEATQADLLAAETALAAAIADNGTSIVENAEAIQNNVTVIATNYDILVAADSINLNDTTLAINKLGADLSVRIEDEVATLNVQLEQLRVELAQAIVDGDQYVINNLTTYITTVETQLSQANLATANAVSNIPTFDPTALNSAIDGLVATDEAFDSRITQNTLNINTIFNEIEAVRDRIDALQIEVTLNIATTNSNIAATARELAATISDTVTTLDNFIDDAAEQNSITASQTADLLAEIEELRTSLDLLETDIQSLEDQSNDTTTLLTENRIATLQGLVGINNVLTITAGNVNVLEMDFPFDTNTLGELIPSVWDTLRNQIVADTKAAAQVAKGNLRNLRNDILKALVSNPAGAVVIRTDWSSSESTHYVSISNNTNIFAGGTAQAINGQYLAGVNGILTDQTEAEFAIYVAEVQKALDAQTFVWTFDYQADYDLRGDGTHTFTQTLGPNSRDIEVTYYTSTVYSNETSQGVDVDGDGTLSNTTAIVSSVTTVVSNVDANVEDLMTDWVLD